MAIYRTVTTAAYCDVCGDSVGDWYDVSVDWAKYFLRQKGHSTGKKIKCKKCRIKERMEKCSLIKKYGRTCWQKGMCLGFGKSEKDDEPCEKCKKCIACTSFDWEEEKYRLSFEGRRDKKEKGVQKWRK